MAGALPSGSLCGLIEYDIRCPLTSTGTNLRGLVRHPSISESRYFGEVFDRPFPEPLPRWDDAGQHSTDLWATEHETSAPGSDVAATLNPVGQPG
ncbi:hypothetical protein GCM10027160_35180 [Streptomyces calidiresistens]|uniref:DUF664 domain-containing protein n=1 Tax=Streptomyces calidiresistens TaxID=1485586 RepID=A0A7W3T1U8_9ACTN|nr:DUF664 domain-containing protein [Streptomyces calidiresistens]